MKPLVLLGVFFCPSVLGGNADPVFTLGKPDFFGSGCATPSSVRVSTPTDRQSLSVSFTQFVAATSGATTRDRKACNLMLPLRVRPGTSIAIVQVDYAGRVLVPWSSRQSPPAAATFQNEYFFAGSKGAGVNQTWRASNSSVSSSLPMPFTISNAFQVGATAWSPCGGTAVFRINAAVAATKATPASEDVRIAVGATRVGVSSGMHFGVASQPCATS
jgi:hypothetical protein